MEYMHHKDFMPSLQALFQKGGLFQKAAVQVQASLGRLALPNTDPFIGLTPTNHGENRIPKCAKYDLTGFARLIIVREGQITLFCFAGEHSACDSWLDRNRGFTMVADECKRVVPVLKASCSGNSETLPPTPSALTVGRLWNHLPEEYFDRLVDDLPRSTVRALEVLESIHDEAEIYEVARRVEDSERAETIYDVFALLRQDKRQEAVDRIKLYLGETQSVESLTEDDVRALAESETIKRLRSDDPRFQKVFEYFVKSASYMDWMLFLHPDQQSVVDRDFAGPAKLIGVSGSGKTCIVVQRAIRLAEKYNGEKVLVLTLNRQLACLIREMVFSAAPDDTRSNIHVEPFFSLCQSLLHAFEPENDKLYDDVTWKSKEHIDEIWREYYRCEVNNYDAEILSPVHDSLITRSIDAERYIREELDWIRSAVAPDPESRKKYLELQRKGRGFPLDKRFRLLLLEGLGHWETKMRAVGVTDYLGLSTALYRYKEKLMPEYRCILVDESQDFGTIEYELIRKLAKKGENDLFFCGDAAQQVSAKHRSFKEAGIEIPAARSVSVEKNYRNSREVLRAAFDVLVTNLSDEMLDSGDFEVLDPEFANFSAAPPLMLRAANLEEEIAFGLRYVEAASAVEPQSKNCLAICGYTLYQIQKFGEELGLPVLDGNITIQAQSLYLSDLEHTKGFEFDSMVIVNCGQDVLPDTAKPKLEQFRDLARFYVAMTRAKNQLIVSFSGQRSSFLEGSDENFLIEDWHSQVDREAVLCRGVPPSLETIRNFDDGNQPATAAGGQLESNAFLDMSGPKFLYTEQALGLSELIVEKLRNVIPGRSTIRAGTPVAWSTLRRAKEDTDANVRSRQAFGPEGIAQFRALIEQLSPPGE